jgi:hypothetical protein
LDISLESESTEGAISDFERISQVNNRAEGVMLSVFLYIGGGKYEKRR